jgi:hypothetical protein
MMKFKPLTVFAVAALSLAAAAVPRAVAQPVSSPVPGPELGTLPPPPHTAGGHIVINPGRLLYRRCVDWYELQYRPSGTVLFPQMRCWWVRG